MTSPTSIQYFSDINTTVNSFLKQHSRDDFVLDIGTSSRFAKELSSARHYFYRQDNYFALGYNPSIQYGKDNCDISGDILALPFRSSSADAIICLEVLEHVYNPQMAINQLYRVLKPKGQLLLTTPFLLPFHGKGQDFNNPDHELYPDFWRFTHQGLQYLCRNFSHVQVTPFSSTASYYVQTLGRLFRLPTSLLQHSLSFTERIQPKRCGNTTHRHLLIATK